MVQGLLVGAHCRAVFYAVPSRHCNHNKLCTLLLLRDPRCFSTSAPQPRVPRPISRLRGPNGPRLAYMLGKDASMMPYRLHFGVAHFGTSSQTRKEEQKEDLKPEQKEETKQEQLSRLWQKFKTYAVKEAKHYYLGTKLLIADTKMAAPLVHKILRGATLTRRERRQLQRTSVDLFRLVPFLAMVLIPFMEFALPLVIKMFPNFLPSTFKDKSTETAKMKKLLNAKMEVAQFLQETTTIMMEKAIRSQEELAKAKARVDGGEDMHVITVPDFESFIGKVKREEFVDNRDIMKYAQLFDDKLTLDSLNNQQLTAMCQLLEITVYGSPDTPTTNNILRWRIRNKVDNLIADDRVIDKEGIEALDFKELEEACRMRGINPNSSPVVLKTKLEEWIQLSLHSRVPTSLLVLSRAFTVYEGVEEELDKEELEQECVEETLQEEIAETLGHLEEEVVEVAKQKIADEMASGDENVDMQNKLDILYEQQAKVEEEEVAEAEEAEASADEAEGLEAGEAEGKLADGSERPAEEAEETKEIKQEEVVTRLEAAAEPSFAATQTSAGASVASEGIDMSEGIETLGLEDWDQTKEADQIAEAEGMSELHEEEGRLELLKESVNSCIDDFQAKLLETVASKDEMTDLQLKTLDKLFKLADRDGDRALDAAELQKLLSAIQGEQADAVEKQEFSMKEVQELLESVDTDKDGKIKFYEFVEGLDLFREELESHGVSFERLRKLEAEQNKDTNVQTAEQLSDQVNVLLSKVQDDLEKTKEVEKEEKLEKRRTSLMTP